MNKKLMAVAVAGALGAPAAAWAQNYQIYGRAHAGVDQYEAKGATGIDSNLTAQPGNDFKKRTRVYDQGSRVGFRGTEDLGGGLQADFLIESGLNLDTGGGNGQSGAANTSTGTWASRANHVGLAGGFGKVLYGKPNVWWGNGPIERVGAALMNAGGQLFSGTFGRGMGVGVTRQPNTMQYITPTFSGVRGTVSLSPNLAEAQGPGANTDGQLLGVTVEGSHGPIHWGFDYVTNEGNTSAAGLQGSNTATKLRVGYAYMPGAMISFLSITNEVKNGGAGLAAGSAQGLPGSCATTTGCVFEQTGVGVSWEHMFGPYHAIVQATSTGDIEGSGCANTVGGLSGAPAGEQCQKTSSSQLTLGMRYVFSKRTAAYVSYNKIENDERANLDFPGAGITARQPATQAFTGADPTIIAAGVLHNF